MLRTSIRPSLTCRAAVTVAAAAGVGLLTAGAAPASPAVEGATKSGVAATASKAPAGADRLSTTASAQRGTITWGITAQQCGGGALRAQAYQDGVPPVARTVRVW